MRIRLVAVVAIALFLSACQTDQTGSSVGLNRPVEYSVFFDQGDHVKKLLDEGRFEDASKVYSGEIEFFRAKGNTYNDLRARLRAGVKDFVHPGLETATNRVARLDWPAPPSQWVIIAKDIKTLKEAIEGAESHLILMEGAADPVLLGSKRQITETESEIRQSANEFFKKMVFFSKQVFEDVYPVPVDMNDLFHRNRGFISLGFTLQSAEQLELFRKKYSDYIDAIQSRDLSRAYFAEIERVQVKQGKSKLAAFIAAIAIAEKKGFQTGKLDKNLASIRVVDVTSRTLVEAGEIQFEIGLDIDLPLDVEKADLDAALTKRAGSKVDVLILIDVAAARTNRDVKRMEKASSKFVSGSQIMQNPKYATAQNNVTIAQTNFNTENLRRATRPRNSCDGCLGDLLREMFTGVRVKSEKEKLQDALAILAATPIMIEVPIYRTYQFERAYVHAVKTAVVHYYVIDRASNTFVKGTFDAEEKREFTILYDVRPDDRNLDEVTSGANSQSEVAAFERQPLTVSLSDILREYTDARIPPRPLPSQVALRREILDDKNIVLAKFQKERVEAVHDGGKAGKRMDSVVFIRAGKFIGSGFYINDTTVLTNYHVVGENKFVDIQLYNGTETFGKVIALEARVDLALVKVQHRGTPVAFLNLRKVPIGATVHVLGSPHGFKFSTAQGIISAVRKAPSVVARGGNEVLFIQTDAAINGGNSGGPMYLGEYVIGVNDWSLVGTGISGLNFAIHVSEVVRFLKRHNENFKIVEAGS